jgi:hypothetical protein
MQSWVMMRIFNKLFCFKHPRKRYIYAVTGGKYLGELLIYINQSKEDYFFLTVPEMKNRVISIDKFKFGLDENILDIVQKIPKSVYKVCRLQYKKNIETNTWAN